MGRQNIAENVKKIMDELPEGVELVAAAKARTPEEVKEAIAAGVKIIGENYVQEAAEAFAVIDVPVKWHFIGHLQKNKVKKAVEIFDVIETVDSVELAKEIDKRCGSSGKVMDVLVEINSGKEPQKFGVFPDEAGPLIEKIAALSNIRIKGLMTMGPFSGAPEDARPYFIETRKVFEKLKAGSVPGVEMEYLSMGMTNSYRVAIEEGANIVRIGTKIFGERNVY
jgi:pyridoxal phosphate enzyme (YggS family)